MNELDAKLRALVQEMADAAPVVETMLSTPTPASGTVRRPWVRPALVMAVPAIVALVVVGVWMLTTGDGRQVDVGPSQEVDPTTTIVGVPLDEVTSLGPDQWVYPSVLPEGYEYGYAVGHTPLDPRELYFLGPDGELVVRIFEGEPSDRHPMDPVVVFENAWVGIAGPVIAVDGLASQLVAVNEEDLPRRPIDLWSPDAFVDVASIEVGGRGVMLAVSTDGAWYGGQVSHGTSAATRCCLGLGPAEVISSAAFEGWEGSDGPESVGYVVVDESVASVEVRLPDGRILEPAIQDLAEVRPVNFFLFELPEGASAVTGPLDGVVVAFDADGNELGRAYLE